MRAVRVLLFLCVMLLAASCASALNYDGLFTGPQAIGYYDEDTLLVAERDSGHVYEFYPDGVGSSSLKFDNMPYFVNDVAIDSGGNYYFIFYTGAVYKYDGTVSGIVDWSTHAANFTQICDLGANNGEYYNLAVTSDGVIYASIAREVKKIEPPLYTPTTVYTGPSSTHVEDIALHPDGLVVVYANDASRAATWAYVIDGSGTLVNTVCEGAAPDARSVGSTTNGNVYVASYDNGIYWYNASNSYSSHVLDSLTKDSYMDFVITDSGIIYTTHYTGNRVVAVAANEYDGGYNSGYVPAGGDDSGNTTGDDFSVGDSHEWTNEEIISGLRQTVPNIFFLLLLFYFMYVMGGK